MTWQTLPMPRSADTLLNKVKVTATGRPFSKVQTAMAILDWFATFPLEVRLEMVAHYLQQLPAPDQRTPATTAAPLRQSA